MDLNRIHKQARFISAFFQVLVFLFISALWFIPVLATIEQMFSEGVISMNSFTFMYLLGFAVSLFVGWFTLMVPFSVLERRLRRWFVRRHLEREWTNYSQVKEWRLKRETVSPVSVPLSDGRVRRVS